MGERSVSIWRASHHMVTMATKPLPTPTTARHSVLHTTTASSKVSVGGSLVG